MYVGPVDVLHCIEVNEGGAVELDHFFLTEGGHPGTYFALKIYDSTGKFLTIVNKIEVNL